MGLSIKRPVNVYCTIYRPLVWYFIYWMVLAICINFDCLNWFGYLVSGDWSWLGGNAGLVSSFLDSVMNCLWFWLCSNFLSRFSFACCCCYKPLVSGFAGWLKLIVIKNPCKTRVLQICWNNLWYRCWRLMGKCVIFGFFAADTATKQPKWLVRKCRSTAL